MDLWPWAYEQEDAREVSNDGRDAVSICFRKVIPPRSLPGR